MSGEVLELSLAGDGGLSLGAIEYALSRELTECDIDVLARPQGVVAQPLSKLRESHHMLAKLLARGLKAVEVAAITGFSQSRISILKNDPSFKELLAYYKDVEEQAFADISGQLAALSADVVGELRDRILETPESFTNTQILSTAALILDRTGHGPTSKQEVTHNHAISSETLEEVKSIVRGSQNGTITTRTIEGRATKETASDNQIPTISIPDLRGAEVQEATVQGGEGQGQGLREEASAKIIRLGN